MIERLKKLRHSRHWKANLFLIVVAAVLLEMISGIQYYHSRNILEEELEKQAEMELTLKSIIAGSARKIIENTLQNHIWDMKRNLAYPDSMFSATEWLLKYNNNKLVGGGIAFILDYYPQKGRFFQPYAYWKDGKVVTTELKNDYSQSKIYKKVMESDSTFWSDVYYDSLVMKKNLISFCLPVHDTKEKTVAVMYMDIDTEWLGDTLNYRHIFPSSFDMLLTKEGKLVAGPREDLVSKATIDHLVSIINDSTIEKRKSEKTNCRIVEFRNPDNGEKGNLFITNMKGKHKWQVVVACYDKEVFDKLNHLRRGILLLMAIAVILLGLIVNRFAKNDKRLQATEMAKDRIDSELRIAKRIQMDLLPKSDMPAPDRQDIRIRGFLVPAKEVGGDLYDYFIRDEKLIFCIGDVSGKGVPSAIVMAMTKAYFRSASSHENNPARIMQAVNENSCEGNSSNMFVTLFIGVLDLPTGRLRYCTAGHDAPILSLGGEECQMLEVKPNLPVGLFDDFIYEMQEMILPPSTTIFLYTDGVTEAKNKELKLFGLKRLQEVFRASDHTDPETLLNSITTAVHQFTGDTEQSDDLTMLVVRYIPQEDNYTLNESLTLKNDVHQVTSLSTFLKSLTEKLELEPSLAKNIRLGVEEAVVNVMDYAYPSGVEGDVQIDAKANGQWLKIIISDNGVAFDPTETAKADTTLSAEDRPVGGLGILLVRELMDTINYERINGKNILTLTKNYKT